MQTTLQVTLGSAETRARQGAYLLPLRSRMTERELELSAHQSAAAPVERLAWLDGLVRAVLVLNLLDAVFTLMWVRTGLADEGNAFMRDLVHGEAIIFVVVKIALVSLGCLFLWGRRTNRLAVIAIFVAFAVYYLVLLLHLAALSYHGLPLWN